MSLHEYEPHPHEEARAGTAAVKTLDKENVPGGRFNTWLAQKITAGVGTMWCAYAFAVLDMFALPHAIHDGAYGIVQWIASFFLQLVLLSVLQIGQNASAAAADRRAEMTYEDTEMILHELRQLQAHLLKQDEVIMNGKDHH